MNYAQPPAGGGYPPQGAQSPVPQQAPQGYYEQPRPYTPPGPVAPPASVVLLGGLAMILLGVILRGVTGFMDPGDSSKNIYAVGALLMGVGLVLGAHAMFHTGLKDKEAPNGVRATSLVIAVVLVVLAILVSFNGIGMARLF